MFGIRCSEDEDCPCDACQFCFRAEPRLPPPMPALAIKLKSNDILECPLSANTALPAKSNVPGDDTENANATTVSLVEE